MTEPRSETTTDEAADRTADTATDETTDGTAGAATGAGDAGDTPAGTDADGGRPIEVPGDDEPEGLRGAIIERMRTVFDPEIPVNIYDLGLIYGLDIDADAKVKVTMTLTSPGCPVAATFPEEVRGKVESVDGVESAEVDLVWDPPYTMDMMSEAARLELGM